MKAAELRKSILQAAVQGKLVSQNAHDEPASELLKRIQQEKIQLINQGKIKKEKPLPPILEEEIPYDLPDGWVWCKLGELCNVNMGQSPDGNSVSEVGDGIEFHQGKSFFSKTYLLKSNKITNQPTKIASKGDILLAVRAPVGVVNITPREICIGRGLCALQKLLNMDSIFIYYFMQTMEEHFNTQATGTTFIAIAADIVKNALFPLPPLAEQQRIVAKADELMALCDKLEATEKELDTLEVRFAEYLPKSILQAAVQGKLVPQNTHDEPASELLKRIQQEKARLIKKGKIKKEKSLPVITEDEIPYDLPDGWIWCRLREIIELTENNNIQSNFSSDTLINYVDIDSIDNNSHKIRQTKLLPVKKLSSRARRVIKKGYIIYSLVRPYLDNIAIAEEEKENFIGSTGFVVFRPIYIPNRYFIIFLLSPHIKEYYLSLLSGFNSPSISQEKFLSTLIPLPPLAEQQRIVTKADDLMALCEELKNARNLSAKPTAPDIIKFPQKDIEDEVIGIAARGNAARKHSDKLKKTINDLFGDD